MFSAPKSSTPNVSSPLASVRPVAPGASSRPNPSRKSSFPTSRPLRPFASIAQSLANAPSVPRCSSLDSAEPRKTVATGGTPIKLIEPPKGFEGCFLLNLTQAEFSRRD
ncbi:hypothetical protein PUNSTDRAFT_58731 [Punctularia strigosozonata HHB-11173 SS5]|uniref:uncharacterized protein n=1 Tax=Punctularia strigosozonata (strain HHB-11173) TaxID=741275 RepID=UPI0004416F78|nr:uncharacterized protein PUNSTDRAFT_58731 [Punctularia strigosozonata HHB-11173 SS5]EIN13602.1 hypothetical protein PUNSTDRAFT_58731 [Punctularia strigosozonata HHB-11173 SS5]